MTTFGERLKNARTAKNVSQPALGEVCGVSRNAVSSWEHNTTKPTFDNLIQVCEYLEVSADELLGLKTAKLQISGMTPKSLKAARKISSLSPEARSHILGLIDLIPSESVSNVWNQIFSYDPAADPRHEKMMKIIEEAQKSEQKLP